MNWACEDIANFGKAAYPDNTEWREYRHLKDRIREYKQAATEAYKEELLVSIYIHLAMLSRFDPCVLFFNHLLEETHKGIEKRVQVKMTQITNRRKERDD